MRAPTFFFILAPCEKHIIFNISFQIFSTFNMFFITKNTVDKHDIFCLKNNVEKKHNDYYSVSKLVKGVPPKTSLAHFCFVISQLIQHQNLKILVPSPHNYQGTIWGGDKNFQVFKFSS